MWWLHRLCFCKVALRDLVFRWLENIGAISVTALVAHECCGQDDWGVLQCTLLALDCKCELGWVIEDVPAEITALLPSNDVWCLIWIWLIAVLCVTMLGESRWATHIARCVCSVDMPNHAHVVPVLRIISRLPIWTALSLTEEVVEESRVYLNQVS